MVRGADIDYMRSRPTIRKRTPTERQLVQQARFTTAVEFETTMTGLLETSFKNYAVKMSGYNSALSYNLKNAVVGKYPAYSIDYSKALISRGKLPNAVSPAATLTGETVFLPGRTTAVLRTQSRMIQLYWQCIARH